MGYKTKVAVSVLDFVLIMMTAMWIFAGIARGLDFIELGYNYLYLTLSIVTLILNLKLINGKNN
ncbi:MAG: hypothetical protein KKC75_02250 [Nanoarchaeota archaeon]|nr:hypothetical protein [Nanoarchaeota archaeon]MBU1005542.1 hypothetical protein [Nanoarchaeota archaeon]MBU1946601.1 hypothetical protein [Nanoarchaeota archaeon]